MHLILSHFNNIKHATVGSRKKHEREVRLKAVIGFIALVLQKIFCNNCPKSHMNRFLILSEVKWILS